jgi:hypothetical protein
MAIPSKRQRQKLAAIGKEALRIRNQLQSFQIYRVNQSMPQSWTIHLVDRSSEFKRKYTPKNVPVQEEPTESRYPWPSKQAVIEVTCPYCNQLPGAECKTITGKTAQLTHDDRIEVYRVKIGREEYKLRHPLH